MVTWPSLALVIFLALETNFSGINIVPASMWLVLTWCTIFQCFYFYTLCLYLKWVITDSIWLSLAFLSNMTISALSLGLLDRSLCLRKLAGLQAGQTCRRSVLSTGDRGNWPTRPPASSPRLGGQGQARSTPSPRGPQWEGEHLSTQ